MLGHALFATNARPLEEGETNLSGARGRLLVPDGEKIRLTGAILTASIRRTRHPERDLHGQKQRRGACSSILLSSCPERKVTDTLRLERHDTKNGTDWLRSETGHAWNLAPVTVVAVGTGCSESLSGAKAFGCFCRYSGAKLRTPAPRGLTLLLNRTRRHAASGRRGRLSATDLAGRLTYAVAGRFEQRVRPRSKRLERLAVGRR